MPLTLTNPETINAQITDEEITAFAVDIENGLIYVTYNRLDGNGNAVVRDVTETLQGAEMTAAIARASEIAGSNVYSAIKQALYEFLPGNGTIS